MADNDEDDRKWVAQLPTLEGIFPENNSTNLLLRSFSRLSIPFFRRNSSTTGSYQSLQPLFDLSEELKNGEEVDEERAKKALGDLVTYSKQVKERLSKASAPDDQQYINKLAEGYLRGFHLICEIVGESHHQALQRAATDCFEGLNLLACVPEVTDDTKTMLQRSICWAMFASEHRSTAAEPYLEPIFRRTRSLISAIGRGELKRSSTAGELGGQVDCIVRAGDDLSSEQGAIHYMERLVLFQGLVALFETLPVADPVGRESKAETKAREDGDRDRRFRVIVEASIAQCELATTLASTDISNVRERSRVSQDPKILVRATLDVGDSDSDTSDGGSGYEADNDVKPVIKEGTPPVKSEAVDDNEDETKSSISSSSGQTQMVVQWEKRAEATLLLCLRHASLFVITRQTNIVTESIRPTAWFPGTNPSGSRSATPYVDGDSDTDSDADTLATDVADDKGDELASHDPSARPPPLKTIFRLQDRYEELRLAVWLSLPPDSRGKMSAYMRGIPTPAEIEKMEASGMEPEEIKMRKEGKVGNAWDALGLALLKHFDGDTLLDFGLDLEKLDKWQDLASAKDGGKAKKSRKTM